MAQKRYANDGSVLDRLQDLLWFFKQITEHGSYCHYTANAPKCLLILKEASNIEALRLFEGKAVKIVDSFSVLGSVIGNEKAYESFNVTTAGKRSNFLKSFGQIAKTCSLNAYLCLTRGVQKKLKFRVYDERQRHGVSSQTRKPTF